MTIVASFKEIRQTTDRIINIVSVKSGTEKVEIGINTAINDDLGVDGDDWVELAIELQEKEGLNLEGLKFYDYFQDEGQIADPTGALRFIVRCILYLVTFSWLKAKFSDVFKPLGPPKEILTIGDLITSKFEGKFVKRNDRRFALQTG
jgi:acyl carrier protein